MNFDASLAPGDVALAHTRAALAQQGIERQRSSSPAISEALGLGVVEAGGAAALYATAVPWSGANTIVNLGLDHSVTRSDLQQLLTPFQDHGLPLTVTLSPLAQTAHLLEWLNEAGLVEEEAQCVLDLMLAPFDLPVGTGALVTERLTEQQLPDFARLILGEDAPAPQLAYVGRPGAPNVFRYGAVIDGQLIAAAQMTVIGRLGHISGASTLPAFRGRGAQGALLHHRLADAIDAGCDQATVEVEVTNSASLRNVERTGFRRRYRERRFSWGPLEGPAKD